MPDLNAASVEAAMRMVEGTARSMGIVNRRLIRWYVEGTLEALSTEELCFAGGRISSGRIFR